MSYVSSGLFRSDIAEATGRVLTPIEPEEEEEEGEEDSLVRFPEPLRTELEALRELVTTYAPPKLCVLSWGDFCSVPELTGEEREEVLEDWLSGDEAATDFVMSAVDIVNGGGGFYIVVNTDGRMGLVCEDPHSFDPLECTMPEFLRALVAAHRAACTEGLDAARAELRKAVDDATSKLLLTFAKRLSPKS